MKRLISAGVLVLGLGIATFYLHAAMNDPRDGQQLQDTEIGPVPAAEEQAGTAYITIDAAHDPRPLSTYTDARTGIMFSYPQGWKVTDEIDLRFSEGRVRASVWAVSPQKFDPTLVRFEIVNAGGASALEHVLSPTAHEIDPSRTETDPIVLNGRNGVRVTQYISHNECTHIHYLFDKGPAETYVVDFSQCPGGNPGPDDLLIANSAVFTD